MPWHFIEVVVLKRKGGEAGNAIERSVIEISDVIRRKVKTS